MSNSEITGFYLYVQNVMFVRAIKSYITRESTLLSFREGDIIKLTNRDMTLDKGEYFLSFKFNFCSHLGK